MNNNNRNSAFWPSYVDIMTTLFAIMLILFAVSFGKFSKEKGELELKEKRLLEFEEKYNEIKSIYQVVENINPEYFEFNKQFVKHIFKIQVTYQTGAFELNKLQADVLGNKNEAESLRSKIVDAGKEIQMTIENLQQNDSIKQDIKYLVVIEGQASADGYNEDAYRNNDVLSYQRALGLHNFWKKNGIDFSNMNKCELVISGSGEKGVPRDDSNEKNNQRFLIHIVPVIGNIKLDN